MLGVKRLLRSILYSLIDIVAVAALKFLSLILSLLPNFISLRLIYLCCLLFVALKPKFNKYALKNLKIAFPDIPESEHKKILHGYYLEQSRMARDSLILPKISKDYINQNIHFHNEREHALLRKNSKTGILIATGHLGSYEMHAYSAAMLGYPLSFVVRNFALPRLDKWWCKMREKSGNKVINRDGAYKEIVKTLINGRDVGILFDQNVTREHAIFVPWFGLEAATTKGLALAAIKTKAPVVVSVLCFDKENNRYNLLWERCDVEKIYEDPDLTFKEKLHAITSEATDKFTEMIRQYPDQWFWIHRRWKTRPDGGKYDY
jgi:KDO2-lipid IV(A) lauroyltransferase